MQRRCLTLLLKEIADLTRKHAEDADRHGCDGKVVVQRDGRHPLLLREVDETRTPPRRNCSTEEFNFHAKLASVIKFLWL
jgi:hypothetical protein